MYHKTFGMLLKMSRSFSLQRVSFLCFFTRAGSGEQVRHQPRGHPAPRRFVAGGGGGGDNDHLETTDLNNCLLYNKNYSVVLSLNSQWEGAAVGSWKLCFNQMSKQEPGALLRGRPSSLPQASFPCEATGLPLRGSSGG